MADSDPVVILDDPAPAEATSAPDAVTIDEQAGGAKLPPGAELLPNGSVRLPLRYPVTVKFRSARTSEVTDETTDALVLHRLTGAGLRAIQAASPATIAVVALAQSARIGEAKFGAVYDRMDAADVTAAAQVVAYFLDSGQTTGR